MIQFVTLTHFETVYNPSNWRIEEGVSQNELFSRKNVQLLKKHFQKKKVKTFSHPQLSLEVLDSSTSVLLFIQQLSYSTDPQHDLDLLLSHCSTYWAGERGGR